MADSIIEQRRLRLVVISIIGIVALFIFFIAYLSVGAVEYGFFEVMDALFSAIAKGGQDLTPLESIVYNLRLPRGLGVIGVGIGLSVAGVVLQAVIRNPLVDPYITGISSGAGLAAAIAMSSGITFFGSLTFTVPIAAFIGAIGAFACTILLAESAGGRPITYVLAGVVVGLGLSAFTTMILLFAGDDVHGILFWLYGSFTGVSWTNVWIILIPVLALTIGIGLYARELNLILLGDEQARQLGLNVRNFKRLCMILASILTAFSVAFTGIIMFLGLIVPHTSRLIVGSDHRILLPMSMLMGANILLLADIVARVAARPLELPVGAIISLIGAPFFAYLMIRRGKEYVG
ncbi:MAG: iron ABC transporter permease [Methanomassiliicoccales archaeon]|nr:iron ABC transporter permease [Methanomassiliicoccales archaeon]NYT14581.1 iron ABC transporter permease [Methanomassiliicoccales archaeon]